MGLAGQSLPEIHRCRFARQGRCPGQREARLVKRAVILAAGRGSRLQRLDPKPLLPLGSQPLLQRTLAAYLESSLDEIVVVLGYQAELVRSRLELDDPRLRWLEHSGWEQGLGSSIAFALNHLSACDEVLLGLGDMPWISTAVIERLLQSPPEWELVAPSYQGRRGHPVLCRPSTFSDLRRLEGDRGAASLFQLHNSRLVEVEEPGILRDVDRPQDVPNLPRVVIWGGGDLATGVAHRLFQSGFPVLILELPQPRMLRSSVAFASAIGAGQVEVEGVPARHFANPPQDWRHVIPVVVDPQGSWLNPLQPDVLIDARLLKRNEGLHPSLAPLVVALGPGLSAGRDCHCVIETDRGHWLGQVIWEGQARPDTGVPGTLGGESWRRVVRSPATGLFRRQAQLGDRVQAGQCLGTVEGQPVLSELTGLLRGLVQDGLRVDQGEKLADVDPRQEVDLHTISDKARAIAGGVLEAILARYFGTRLQPQTSTTRGSSGE